MPFFLPYPRQLFATQNVVVNSITNGTQYNRPHRKKGKIAIVSCQSFFPFFPSKKGVGRLHDNVCLVTVIVKLKEEGLEKKKASVSILNEKSHNLSHPPIHSVIFIF